MESNLKYKNAFLIVSCGVLLQLMLAPYWEMTKLKPEMLDAYITAKILVGMLFLVLIYIVATKKYVGSWLKIFYVGCFSFVLVGQFFHPGYHFAVIEFMFICAIIFEGFPLIPTILMIAYTIEYLLLKSPTHYPAFHTYNLFNALLSSWLISIYMERYVYRVRHKQNFLDRKLRYKGIKTDLFLHDLKNKLQPMVIENKNNQGLKEILKTIQSFNSFNEDHEITFEEVVLQSAAKCKIKGAIDVTGAPDFFIDQMDLQTILSNLMMNSEKAAQALGTELQMKIVNSLSGFIYEDNAGGLTDEQFKFFTQKDIKPYEGHEKNGLGILLIKILIEHQGGSFVIKKIKSGTRFEVVY